MRLPDLNTTRSSLRFNITPMIDVVFLLIIFFLVASYFIRSEQSRQVRLPEAAGGELDQASPAPRLTITVERDGRWSIASQELPESAVRNRIRSLSEARGQGPEPEVRIRADRGTTFGQVRPLVEYCAQCGLVHVRFAVEAESPDSAGGIPPGNPAGRAL
jgi:biopolymer transport protein ExbD